MRDWTTRFTEPRLCSVAAAVIAGAAISAGAGAYESSQASSAGNALANASSQAASSQLQAGQNASNMLMTQGQAAQGDFAPYQATGASAASQLQQEMPTLTAAFNPTEAQLASMPGYQFQLQQGLEATQNGFAARGLGVSGAAMKGAANYATGLAQSNYLNDANIFYQNENNAYNKLSGTANMGLNAASGAAQADLGFSGAAANAMIGQANQAANSNIFAAQAQAAGQVGAANAMGGAFSGIGNSLLGYGMYQNAMNNQGSGNSASYAPGVGTAYGTGMYNSSGYNPFLFGGAN